jgi:hypothetical protein
MKLVVCINDSFGGSDLKLNGIYRVLHQDRNHYYLFDLTGREIKMGYFKKRFSILKTSELAKELFS